MTPTDVVLVINIDIVNIVFNTTRTKRSGNCELYVAEYWVRPVNQATIHTNSKDEFSFMIPSANRRPKTGPICEIYLGHSGYVTTST